MRDKKPIEITFKNGKKRYYGSLTEASKSLGISTTVLSFLIKGHETISCIRFLSKEEVEARRFKTEV